MKNTEKILIVGPSNDVGNFSKEDLMDYKTKGYVILSYSDSLLYFIKNKIKPDYYSFIDPFTLSHYLDTFNTDFCKNTILLTADIYNNSFERFFDLGLTCNSLKNNKDLYNRVLKLNPNKIFKNHITKKYKKTDYKNFINKDYKIEYHMFQNPGHNFCKLSYILLPLIINHFQNLKEIKTIGFGHYSVGRYYNSTNSTGYNEFKDSYTQIKNPLKNLLNKYNIKISFDGSESYYKELTT